MLYELMVRLTRVCPTSPRVVASLDHIVDVFGSGKRIQGIMSTQPNEGGTLLQRPLVLLLAHIGARGILLDCDLRNRSLSAELARLPHLAFWMLWPSFRCLQ
jgi:Mrp family chromosome partitioning ATPase